MGRNPTDFKSVVYAIPPLALNVSWAIPKLPYNGGRDRTRTYDPHDVNVVR